MTTRKFSAISLPYPKYSLEVGCFNLNEKDLDLAEWVPKFNVLTHVIEVKKTGSALSSRGQPSIVEQHLTGSYLMIENFRPELLLRRDFISQFVKSGKIYLAQDNSGSSSSSSTRKDLYYEIQTSNNNRILITMNEEQYRRFGLIAKKVISNKSTGRKHYRIEIDLKDERISKSNKYQDKLVETLKRLKPLDRVYLKFVSNNLEGDKSRMTTEDDDDNKCLNFFKYVIDEYEKDGFKPVPLTNCCKLERKVVREWTNYSQLHPDLSLNYDIKSNDYENILEIVDWLGYQVLSLDCSNNNNNISSNKKNNNINSERLDVKCTEISGCAFDFEQDIGRFFDNATADKLSVFRALIMYSNGKDEQNSNKGFVFLQENCNEKCNLIIKVGLI